MWTLVGNETSTLVTESVKFYLNLVVLKVPGHHDEATRNQLQRVLLNDWLDSEVLCTD